MMKDGQLFRVIDENCWSPDARLRDMEATGKESRPISFVGVPLSLYRCVSSSFIYRASYVQLLGKKCGIMT